MLHYSKKQQKAVIRLLLTAMVIIKREFDDRYFGYIETIAKTMQLFNSEVEDAMNNMSHEESLSIIKDMPLREKARVAIVLYQMFVSDGSSISEHHKRFYNKIDEDTGIKNALISTGLINWVSGVKQLM